LVFIGFPKKIQEEESATMARHPLAMDRRAGG
jgi:hypothetical protein